MTNLEKYNQAFVDALDIDESCLGPEFTFNCVEAWDSVAHLALITELEDAFDIMFEADEIIHYGSYENGKAILEKHGVSF